MMVMVATTSVILAPLLRYAQGLRFPQLFLATAAVFVVDLIVPDLIPFADEALLGLLTLLLGTVRRRRASAADVGDARS